jgi:ribosomal protein S18 acetylase RimI-like enzyme
LIGYRPFTNRDPPALAAIWRSVPGGRGTFPAVTAGLLDEYVLSKPYFDPQGLIVAHAEGRPIGFVHAALGPNDDESDVGGDLGAVCVLKVRPDFWASEAPAGLLTRAEEYLARRKVRHIQALGSRFLAPFYLGLAGGSELRGVPESAADVQALLTQAGYEAVGRFRVLHRDLGGFRPAVNRQQQQVRRKADVVLHRDRPTFTWWESCTLGGFDPLRFELAAKGGGAPWGSVLVWNMERFSTTWGVQAAGLVRLRIDAGQRRQGLATCLVGEAFRVLQSEGCLLVEAQVDAGDAAADRLFATLGFVLVETGLQYQKTLP